MRAALILAVIAALSPLATGASAQTVVGGDRGGGTTQPRDRDARQPRSAPRVRTRAREAPDTPGAAGDRDERLARDPFSTMGGQSPFCSRPLDAQQRESCRRSGALQHPYRIDHYGFDIRIDTGADNIPGNFFYLLQTLALLAWLGLLYLFKGCLLALEWAFSLDLLSDAMGAVRRALERLHRNVLGEPWFLAAIAFAGIWAMWRGLVQRRPTQAIGGLIGTVALMVIALVLIARPADTVGRASEFANQAALGMVAGASTGTFDRPEASFGRATSRLFDTLVLRPWCALEFADIEFCLANPRKVIAEDDLPDDDAIRQAWAAAPTVADLWLRFEPGGDGDDNDQRNRLYEKWRDKDGERLQAVVRIQKQGGTAARIALLLLIAIGMVAAIGVLAWLVFRLLGFGVLALLLVLLAPLMFLAPVLGDSGRATFLAWAKRLLGCLVAKAIYAVFLAVLLVAASALAQAYELGWIAAWVLQIVFWWAVLLRRNDLLAFVTAPLPDNATRHARAGIGHTVREVMHMRATAGMATSAAGAAATPVTRPVMTAVGAVSDRRAAGVAATQKAAENALRRDGSEQIDQRRARSADVLKDHRKAKYASRAIDHALLDYDASVELATAEGKPAPAPTSREQTLLARRAKIAADRPSAEMVATAGAQIRHADNNLARTGAPVTEQDERAWIATRHADHEERKLPVDHDRNLRLAGIDPERYRDSSEPERERLRAQVVSVLDEERARLGATDRGPDRPAPKRREIAAARKTVDDAELREARRQEYATRRQERRAKRARHPRPRQARRW